MATLSPIGDPNSGPWGHVTWQNNSVTPAISFSGPMQIGAAGTFTIDLMTGSMVPADVDNPTAEPYPCGQFRSDPSEPSYSDDFAVCKCGFERRDHPEFLRDLLLALREKLAPELSP